MNKEADQIHNNKIRLYVKKRIIYRKGVITMVLAIILCIVLAPIFIIIEASKM